jgi:hypothetical protein
LVKAERKLEGALALVSGRAIDDLDHLFQLLHRGCERSPRRADAIRPRRAGGGAVAGAVELPASLWAALTRAVRKFPGAFAEKQAVQFRCSL